MTFFDATHDEHGIWYPRFYDSTRVAVDEYIAKMKQINTKILAGELASRRPLAICWDLTKQNLPALQRIVVLSKRNPPPSELTHCIAFIAHDKTVIDMIEALNHHLKEQSKVRRYFLEEERDDALAWLIASTEFVSATSGE